jgi:hypothetical protein
LQLAAKAARSRSAKMPRLRLKPDRELLERLYPNCLTREELAAAKGKTVRSTYDMEYDGLKRHNESGLPTMFHIDEIRRFDGVQSAEPEKPKHIRTKRKASSLRNLAAAEAAD